MLLSSKGGKMLKSIKINKENYEKLCNVSGKLTEKLNRPVSINEAISFLYKKRRLSEIAGTWKMEDKEAEDIGKNLKSGWKKWKIKSA